MIKIAYVLLAHEAPADVADQVKLLLNSDPTAHVVVHYDAQASRQKFGELQDALLDCPRALLVENRIHCEWGKFSLVDAVVRALRVIRDRQLECDYVYLLSCSCVPIRPIATLKRFLRESRGLEFIEAFSSSWIKSGLREERYTRYHWFSWRTQRKLFDASVVLQRKLGIRRRIPKGLIIRFGSQWWCLTRETCHEILDFIDNRPADYQFFRRTWIPDEMFFSTMVATIAGEEKIAQTPLTFFMFTAKGRPITFYDDHGELIRKLPYFFARKVSLAARKLRRSLQLTAASADDGAEFPTLDPAEAKFQYDHLLSRNVDYAKPGQIFYGGQSFGGWPSALGSYTGDFVVLHGPPAVTRLVGERLQAALDVTVLGRVFHPDKVELRELGEEYGGFSATDDKIRDLDRPLYLSRLLTRAKGLPIIEMSPGDDNHAEWFFQQSKNIIFLPCIPAAPDDDDMRRLYWLLVAAGIPGGPAIRPYEMRPVDSFAVVRSHMDAYIDRTFDASHRKWVNDALISPGRSPRMLPMRWALQEGRRLPLDREMSDALYREFGPVILPLITELPSIEFELRLGPGREMLEQFPMHWIRVFDRFFVDRNNQADTSLDFEPPVMSGSVASIPLEKLPRRGR